MEEMKAGDIPCPRCGQVNEQQREACWACGQRLRPKEAQAPQDTPVRFDVSRSVKTKISIDGKEYDRLEDVPEKFRSMLKDGIDRTMADGAKRSRAAAWFIVSPSCEPLDANVPVSLPGGFRFEDTGTERRISLRWFSLGAVGALIFVTVWNGILGVVFYTAFLSKNLPWPALVALLTLGAVGVGMAYAAIAYLVNRTSVRVGASRVSVEHGPLPWFGVRDISQADISRVWSEKIGREVDDDTMFEPSVTYRVRLLLKGGKTLNLVTGLRAPDHALFIEQTVGLGTRR